LQNIQLNVLKEQYQLQYQEYFFYQVELVKKKSRLLLNEMNKVKLPWVVSFSYGRALQDSCLKSWLGKKRKC